MKTQDAKHIRIIDFLASIGYKPAKIRGADFWYLSPLHRESTPSFKVDTTQNLWYDHAKNNGGSVIDLLMQLRNLTISDALKELAKFAQNTTVYDTKPENKYTATILESAATDFTVSEESATNSPTSIIKPLQHTALINYLISRKIKIQIAQFYLQEIHYIVGGKSYFALALRNDSGGYELRNKFYKGSLKNSKKDITTFKGTVQAKQTNKTPKTLVMFEGFMDFLSFFTVQNDLKPENLTADIIVLNTLAMLDKSIAQTQEGSYTEVQLYLDNDDAGRGATRKFIATLPGIKIIDMSSTYNGAKDLNEFTMLNYP